MGKHDDLNFSDSNDDDDNDSGMFAPALAPVVPELAKVRQNSINARQEALIDFLNDDSDVNSSSDDDDADSIAVPEAPAPSLMPSPTVGAAFTMLPQVHGSRMSAFYAESPVSVVPVPQMTPGVPQNASFQPISHDTGPLPVKLQRQHSQFWGECEKVFKWLDDDQDGFISDREISEYLDISRQEARALIEETKITLYGKRGDNRLTLDEFSSILARTTKTAPAPDLTVLPPRLLKRYRIIFDSIDIDGNGVITPQELAQDMGIGEVDEAMQTFLVEAGFAGKSELTFEEFVAVLRRAETDRAGRTFQNILAGTKEGERLANVAEKRHKSIIAEVQKEEVPEVVNTLWDRLAAQRSTLRESLRVDADTLQSVVLEAHGKGELESSDQDLLHVVWQLSEAARNTTDGLVGFSEFAKVLKSSVADAGDIAPLSRIDSVAPSSCSFELPSETLQEGELQALRSVFDSNDHDKDGHLSKEELNQMVLDMIDRSMLSDEVRMFYFQVINGLEESGQTRVDFEEFIILMQEAAEATSSDLDSAVAALNMMKKRISRRSKMLFRVSSQADSCV